MNFRAFLYLRGVVDEDCSIVVHVADVGAQERVPHLPIFPDIIIAGVNRQDGRREGHVAGEGASVDLLVKHWSMIVDVLHHDLLLRLHVVGPVRGGDPQLVALSALLPVYLVVD